MKKIFEKHESLMCILLIVFYVMINSYCMNNLGLEDYRSTLINTIFSGTLFLLVVRLDRTAYYGLQKVTDLKKYLYFIPLLVIASVNLMNGLNSNHSLIEIVFYMLTMLNIGFIEEMLFRGFLFRMMEKDNLKSAMIVSSITFGLGHIVNLLNGREMVSTLFQMCYAIILGYMLVIIFYKSKSIIPCVGFHALINALSVFNVEKEVSYIKAAIFVVIVPLVYTWYIDKGVKSGTPFQIIEK